MIRGSPDPFPILRVGSGYARLGVALQPQTHAQGRGDRTCCLVSFPRRFPRVSKVTKSTPSRVMEGSEEEEEEEDREKFKSVAVTSQELFQQQESRSHSSSHQRTSSDVLARRLQQWMDRFYFFSSFAMLRSNRFFSPVVQTTLIFYPCAFVY